MKNQLKNYTSQLLKDKKGFTITEGFQEILKESKRKPNKIWVDKGIELCNSSF